MKKVTFYLMMMVMSLSVVPTQMLAAEKNPTSVSNTPKEVPAEAFKVGEGYTKTTMEEFQKQMGGM